MKDIIVAISRGQAYRQGCSVTSHQDAQGCRMRLMILAPVFRQVSVQHSWHTMTSVSCLTPRYPRVQHAPHDLQPGVETRES